MTPAGAAVALTGSDQVAFSGPAVYRGFALRETSGSASATVRIYDNASAASGTLLDDIQLAAGESAREWYESGIFATKGIYVKIVSGAVEGSVRTG